MTLKLEWLSWHSRRNYFLSIWKDYHSSILNTVAIKSINNNFFQCNQGLKLKLFPKHLEFVRQNFECPAPKLEIDFKRRCIIFLKHNKWIVWSLNSKVYNQAVVGRLRRELLLHASYPHFPSSWIQKTSRKLEDYVTRKPYPQLLAWRRARTTSTSLTQERNSQTQAFFRK